MKNTISGNGYPDLGEEKIFSSTCTYVHTGRDYANQYFYRCRERTCEIDERNRGGCCLVCKSICHRDHDLVNASKKFFMRSSYCDCGDASDPSDERKLPPCKCFLTGDEIEERLDVIINSRVLENPKNSIKVRWRLDEDDDEEPNIIFIPRYFFPYDPHQEEIRLNEDTAEVGHRLLLKILFSLCPNVEELENYSLTLYGVLKQLRFPKQILFLCCCMGYLNNKTLLNLFSSCIFLIEKEDDESTMEYLQKWLKKEDEEEKESKEEDGEDEKKHPIIRFKSSLSQEIFTVLLERFEMMKSQPEMKKKVQDVENFFDIHELRNHKPSIPLIEHTDFEIIRQSSVSTSPSSSNNDSELQKVEYHHDEKLLQYLHKTRKYWNIELVSVKSPFEVYKCHKELLILYCDFFFRMFKFQGREAHSTRVSIQILNSKALKYLIERIYNTNNSRIIQKSDDDHIDTLPFLKLNSLMQLLVHSEMYLDRVLKKDVMRQLDRKMISYARKGEFLLRVLENGSYLENLPEEIHDDLCQRWAEKLTVFVHLVDDTNEKEVRKKEIAVAIQHSIKTKKMADRIKEYEEENYVMKREIMEMRKRKREEKDDDDDDVKDEEIDKMDQNDSKRRKIEKIE